jgi:hypothetical protein
MRRRIHAEMEKHMGMCPQFVGIQSSVEIQAF